MPQNTYDSYEIHPRIGIARLGTSLTEFFLAPEPDCPQAQFDADAAVPRPARTSLGSNYRAADETLKRQAVRFRIFKVTRDSQSHEVTKCRELRLANNTAAAIKWSLTLVNSKAAGVAFADENGDLNYDDTLLRNADVTNKDDLTIKAAAKSPLGASITAATALTGQFMGQAVTLGHAWTDADGRLLVAGGFGKSGSPTGAPLADDQFADNDGWYDDTSDGIVTATVTVKRPDGTTEDHTTTARIVVAPFDFAPEVDSFVTLYDVCYEAAIRTLPAPGWLKMPLNKTDTLFERDIYSILDRVRGYRWVHAGTMRADVAEKHGIFKRGTSYFAALCDPTATEAGGKDQEKAMRTRKMLLAHLENPDPAKRKLPREVRMPRLHDHDNNDGAVMPLTPHQYQHIVNWTSGTFVNTGAPAEFLCDAMDRIALEACSGGPFFPGMEMSRIMREPTTYQAPFQITDDINKLPAGKLTEGLAVPWQADFFECVMDGENAWWPATRPDKAFVSTADFDKPTDFQSEAMEPWVQGIIDHQSMVDNWSLLGIVRSKSIDDPKNNQNKITVMVETERDNVNLPRQRIRNKLPPA